jgi:hypothetical protein
MKKNLIYIVVLLLALGIISGELVLRAHAPVSKPTSEVAQNEAISADTVAPQTPVTQQPVQLHSTTSTRVAPTTQSTSAVPHAQATLIAGITPISLPFTPGETLIQALTDARTGGTLQFTGKEYPDLGFFVTSIGSLKAGDGKNLLYYINGKEATVGVSTYVLASGDVIEWKLK